MAEEQYVTRHWLRDARAEYLLRPDISWPLSVDPLVWPSVFYSPIFRNPAFESYSTIEVDHTIDGGSYWLDLDRMRTHYDLHLWGGPHVMADQVAFETSREALVKQNAHAREAPP
jgi:hypothetical protein